MAMTLMLPAGYPTLPGMDHSVLYEWERQNSRCNSEPQEDADSRVDVPTCDGQKDDEMDGDNRCCKRKACEWETSERMAPPPKRISPYWNTPKQRKDDRRRVLGVTTRKLRKIGDPERCLRRAVLLNNTLQILQHELAGDEVTRASHSWARRARREAAAQRLQGNLFEDHLPHWCDFDDTMAGDDAVNDALVRNVKNLLGSCGTATSDGADVTTLTTLADVGLFEIDSTDPSTLCDSTTTDWSSSLTNTDVRMDPDVIYNADTNVDASLCSNLTEDERLVLGEMDTVFTNFMKVISAEPVLS